MTVPSVPTVTPVTAPNAEPSTFEPLKIEAVASCVRPTLPGLCTPAVVVVPKLTESTCGARPDVLVLNGMVMATVPEAGELPFTLARLPSVLKATVPSEIGAALVRLVLLPE